jgi:hypothetical protein
MAKTSNVTVNSKPVVKTELAGQTLVTLRTLTEENPASLATYEKLGGYVQLKRLVSEKVKAPDIISQAWPRWRWLPDRAQVELYATLLRWHQISRLQH